MPQENTSRITLYVQPTQARQPPACPTPGAGERLGAHNGLLFSPTLMPPGMGWETHQLISISSFTSFTPTIPWCQGGTWHQFSFRPRAAPELYGSPELGVRGPSCIGDPAGAPKKKPDKKYLCEMYGKPRHQGCH